MNYEKKYNEALERAKNLRKDAIDMGEDIRAKQCEIIFPELNESDDERIRQELITHCRNTRCVTEEGAERIAKWIAWLEKQDEQEPIEWKDSDEKYLFWALLSIQKDIAVSEINGVNTKDLNDCVKWLYSLKQRIGG